MHDLDTIQLRLQRRCLYAGPIDGIWGRGSSAGVSAVIDRLDLLDPLPAPIGQNGPPAVTPSSPFPAVARFFSETITAHEGVLSMRKSDGGNYQGGKVGAGKLIGSQYGVTPPALGLYIGRDPYTLTNADMRAITRELAVQIGVKNYYDVPNLDLLPWSPVIASAADKCWGSGTKWGVRLLQRAQGLKGDDEDGIVGGTTIRSHREWIARVGIEAAALAFAQVRRRFDASLPTYHLNPGWDVRTDSFLPGTPFWRAFA